MRKIFLPMVFAISVMATVLIACSKDNDRSTTLRVRMTDAPLLADSVNVDIRQVRVNLRNDTASWIDLNTHAGIYNLLGLQAGVDTLIASGQLSSNAVQEIRLVLGTSNTIVVSGVSYPLTIPSGAESGLKLKINKTLNSPLDSLLIDFDAALSIHEISPGNYQLRPVLKIK